MGGEGEVLRCGVLTKRGGSVRTWKRRFFVLTREGDELKFTYYKPKSAGFGKRKGVRFFARKDSQPSPTPELQDPQQYKDEEPLGCFFLSRMICFNIQTPQQKGRRMLRLFSEQRTFYVYARNDRDLEPWIYAIRQTLQHIDNAAGLKPSIRMTGELKKRPSHKRWFELKNDVLFYYGPDPTTEPDPRGAFVVKAGTAYPINTDSPSSFEFAVCLKRRTLRLTAPTYEERMLWLQHLELCGCNVLAAAPSVLPSPVRRQAPGAVFNMDSDASDDDDNDEDEDDTSEDVAAGPFEDEPVTRSARACTVPIRQPSLPARDAFDVWSLPSFEAVHAAFEPACLARLLKRRTQYELRAMAPGDGEGTALSAPRPGLMRQSRVESQGHAHLGARALRTKTQPVASDRMQQARKSAVLQHSPQQQRHRRQRKQQQQRKDVEGTRNGGDRVGAEAPQPPPRRRRRQERASKGSMSASPQPGPRRRPPQASDKRGRERSSSARASTSSGDAMPVVVGGLTELDQETIVDTREREASEVESTDTTGAHQDDARSLPPSNPFSPAALGAHEESSRQQHRQRDGMR